MNDSEAENMQRELAARFARSSGSMRTLRKASVRPNSTTSLGTHAWFLSSGCE